MKFLITLLLLSLLCDLMGNDGVERWAVEPQVDLYENKVGAYIANLLLKDSADKAQNLYSKKSPYTVITIFDIDCPISLKLVPKIQRLEKEFPQLTFKHIYISKLAAKDEVLQVYRKRSFSGELLFDTKSAFLNTLKVKTTCENFVVDKQGTLLYRGAVDDQYGISLVKKKVEKSYLKNSLTALLKGERVSNPLTGAPGCLVAIDQKKASMTSEITFHKEISRIVQEKCQQCHRKGGVGPFELMTFEQVKERRKMIKYVVGKGIMPPWFAEEGGPWKHNYGLSKEEKETLLTWLSSGTPEGDKKQAPLPRKWSSKGIIKNPDLIVKFPKVKVQAEGFMRYKKLMLKVPITEDKWVKAVETRTKNPQVLHHALSFILKDQRNRRINALSGFFSGYVPGTTINIFPEGTAKFLPKGSYLMIQLHYTPNGTAVEDEVSLAFEFYDGNPEYQIMTKSAFNTKLKIPPHKENHVVVAEHRFKENGYLAGFNGHAHLRAKSFKYELIQANGEKETLINIPKYDFNWQINYELLKPLFVPAGATVKVTAAFDNSSKNKANPNPNATVRFGEQTDDEMMIGYFEWYAARSPGKTQEGKPKGLEGLPASLKKHVLKVKKELLDGRMNKQQAKKSIAKTIQAGVKKGDYTRQKVSQYVELIKNEFNSP